MYHSPAAIGPGSVGRTGLVGHRHRRHHRSDEERRCSAAPRRDRSGLDGASHNREGAKDWCSRRRPIDGISTDWRHVQAPRRSREALPADDRVGQDRAEIATAEGMLGLPVHQEDFALGDGPAALRTGSVRPRRSRSSAVPIAMPSTVMVRSVLDPLLEPDQLDIRKSVRSAFAHGAVPLPSGSSQASRARSMSATVRPRRKATTSIRPRVTSMFKRGEIAIRTVVGASGREAKPAWAAARSLFGAPTSRGMWRSRAQRRRFSSCRASRPPYFAFVPRSISQP